MDSTDYQRFTIDFFNPAYINDQTITGKRNQMQCDFDSPRVAEKVCAVDVSNLGDCTLENGFGYNKSSPCIFLKLNRVSIKLNYSQ